MNPLDQVYASVALQCAGDITPEPIGWLWDGFLAKGKLHIFAGTAGTGKTTIALALAASVTTAGRFPDGTKSPLGSVLIWSGEDDPADTLVPRLMASGADLNRVYFVGDTTTPNLDQRAFDPACDMQALMDKALTIPDLALVILDPIVNAVAGDSHKNGEVRRSLQPVVTFAEKLDCAALGITHFSKGGQGKDPLERVTGSLAFGALARIVLATAKITEGDTTKRIFCRAKSNIGPDDGGFEYALEQIEVMRGIFTSYAVWGNSVEGSARQLLAEPEERNDDDLSALDEAMDFLRDALDSNEVAQKEIEKEAKAAGHTLATIRRAKAKLGIKSSKSTLDGRWYWSIKQGAQGVSLKKHEHVEHVERLPMESSSQGIYSKKPLEHVEHLQPEKVIEDAQGAQSTFSNNYSESLICREDAQGEQDAHVFVVGEVEHLQSERVKI